MKTMPDEFTVAFWVLPTDMNVNSYFINLFGRAFVWSSSATNKVYYKFITGASTSV